MTAPHVGDTVHYAMPEPPACLTASVTHDYGESVVELAVATEHGTVFISPVEHDEEHSRGTWHRAHDVEAPL